MKYIVSLITTKEPNRGGLESGKFKIVDADNESEARKRGAEELVLDGKLPSGFGIKETKRLVKVEKYKGNW